MKVNFDILDDLTESLIITHTVAGDSLTYSITYDFSGFNSGKYGPAERYHYCFFTVDSEYFSDRVEFNGPYTDLEAKGTVSGIPRIKNNYTIVVAFACHNFTNINAEALGSEKLQLGQIVYDFGTDAFQKVIEVHDPGINIDLTKFEETTDINDFISAARDYPGENPYNAEDQDSMATFWAEDVIDTYVESDWDKNYDDILFKLSCNRVDCQITDDEKVKYGLETVSEIYSSTPTRDEVISGGKILQGVQEVLTKNDCC